MTSESDNLKTRSNTHNNPFVFYSKSDYYRSLIENFRKTKKDDRILLATMSFEPSEDGVMAVIDELGLAAKRGVTVNFIIDAYCFISNYKVVPGPLFLSDNLDGHMFGVFRERLKVIRSLEEQGVVCTIINKPKRRFSSFIGGRSHLKLGVINNYFYIGGCNLGTVEDIDLMIGLDDEKTANWLYELGQKLVTNEGTSFMQESDGSFQINSDTELLIDCGKRNQSIILNNAFNLIDEAKSRVLLTCQFFPNSLTAKHLLKAFRRGVNVCVIYNTPSKHTFPFSLLHFLVGMRERLRLPSSFFSNRLRRDLDYLHAKILFSEQAAIIGSHNFVPAGVKLGTAEIAIKCSDPKFINQAMEFVKQNSEQEILS